ncbi:origin recognition complex subunit 5-like [Palaemon carinicauda]|uniref:origin recognition complex subunit 5-like n=2 Tax=Palaemon carinicauda TaxID=392227 RepID=UPI0035B66588
MKNIISELQTTIPCRKDQIQFLVNILGEEECLLPCSLFLYGHRGTGKTLVTKTVLEKLNIVTSHVNCIEFYTTKVIYETILNNLSGTIPSSDNGYTSYASCDNFGDFIRFLKLINKDNGKPRMAVVIENSERLRDCDANILPAFCRLQELAEDVNISVIFCSTLPIDKFRSSTGMMEPIVYHFPQYTKDELVEILMKGQPSTCSDYFYKTYVNIVLSVFYLASKSLTELKHQVLLHFKTYCEPIQKGEATEDDIRKLWRNIEPHLKKALDSVYLREVSSAQFKRMQQLTESGITHDLPHIKSTGTKVELPFYSKFLLIAAYLASYNPARTDRRFFVKHHGKQRKTHHMIKAKEKSSSQLVGPKPFPLDRMMAIFYSIVEDKVTPTANIFSQISTLVTLKLVTQVGGDDQLDAPKYKCAVSLNFIRGIARTVGFDIIRYLYDFA